MARWLLIALLHLPLGAPIGAAEPNQFRPAMFGTGDDSLPSQLQCPGRWFKETDAVVFCQARIRSSGKPHRSYCFAYEPELLGYQREANKAVDRSKFVPASIDGESVEVLFSFRVSFSWVGETCNFAVIPNWGFGDETIGLNHIAPQEVLIDGKSWSDRVAFFTGPRGDSIRPGTGIGVSRKGNQVGVIGSGLMFSISSLVSSEGLASDARLEKNFFGADSDIEKSLKSIQDSRFIPGFVENKPTSMRYFDVLFVNPDY